MLGLLVCLGSQAYGQWLTGYDFRKEITIDGTEIIGSANHNNFPVLIRLTDANVQAAAMANGHDIAFTESDGATELDHDLELYVSGTGEIVAWVRTNLTPGADKVLYMYYGNSSASDPSTDASDTWNNADYQLVYHMESDGTDASSYGRNGSTPGTSAPASVTGYIGNARYFSGGTTDFCNPGVDCAYDGDFYDTGYSDDLTNFTISAWVYADAAPAGGTDGGIIMREGNYNLGWNHSSGVFRESFFFQHSIDGFEANKYNSPVGSTWYYLTATWDGDRMRTYQDGVLVNTNDLTDGPPDPETVTAKIGRHALRDWWYEGIIDEARISSVVHDDNWVQTEYNNQRDPGPGNWIKTLGTEEPFCTVATGSLTPVDSEVESGNATTITVSGQDGAATLQWQSSPDNSAWSDMVGQTSTSANTGSLTSPTYFRLAVTNVCTNYSPSLAIGIRVSNVNNYAYRKKITLDGADIFGSHTGFPALISLASDADLAANVQNTDGYDILFTDSDGSTVLDHELETFDDGTGALVAWVNTDLTGSTDKEIYMYYGNASVSVDQSSTATWDTDYVGVWHFNNDEEDATVNNHDVTYTEMSNLAAGKIGAGKEANEPPGEHMET
ncbi:MAG: DUF2341 domain-containing protein, partial [Bacteroidota bacterium]